MNIESESAKNNQLKSESAENFQVSEYFLRFAVC